jgi:predicted nucleic acid-binding protein
VLVVDASVATLWFLPQAGSPAARALLTRKIDLVGPDILQLEVGSAVLRAVRRGQKTAEEAREAVFHTLPAAVRLVDYPGLSLQAYGIATQHGGSLYDALYVALAQALGADLVTDDARMCSVALGARVRARMLGDGLPA